MLKSVGDGRKFVAEDREADVHGERLELLAVVRGLEALDQPSRVTLFTGSRYVSRGLTEGLENWRENDWQWERFGEWVPVRDRDLWKRVDRALKFHMVECRRWRFDRAHGGAVRGAPRITRRGRTAVRAETAVRSQVRTKLEKPRSHTPTPVRPAHSRRGSLAAFRDLCRRGISGILAGVGVWERTGGCG